MIWFGQLGPEGSLQNKLVKYSLAKIIQLMNSKIREKCKKISMKYLPAFPQTNWPIDSSLNPLNLLWSAISSKRNTPYKVIRATLMKPNIPTMGPIRETE